MHHTALLLELIESGRLDVGGRLGHRVTYHDPCHLGRYNGELRRARADARALGCELVEMPRNRDNSFCCGAGGGRIWMTDDAAAPSARRRTGSARRSASASVDYFVVACPKDVTMYEDAIKTSGNGERIELREVTELIEEALVKSPELLRA